MIVASAILHDGIIFTGVRHSEIIEDLVRLGYSTPISNSSQGFITDAGDFLYRPKAKEHALKCGQITSTISNIMTSEDLW